MRKNVSRLLSVVIALVMVFSMAASAEATRMQVKINTPSGVMDASLTTGFDADGCQQIIAASSAIGEWLLQADGQALTFGSDANGYVTINAEELREAITTIVYALTSELPIDDIMSVVNYLTGPMFESDMETAAAFFANEVNRFASVAMEMGLIVISENGDLTVKAEYNEMISLLANYLNALSQDTAAIGQALQLNIFAVLKLDVAPVMEQAPAMIRALAQEVAASAAYAGEGGLYIFLAASGEMEIEVTTKEDDFVATYSIKSDASGVNTKVSGVEGDYFVIFNMNAGAEGMVFTVDYSADGNVADIDYVVNAEGESIVGKIDIGDVKCTINYVENASGVVCNFDAENENQSWKLEALENAEGASCDLVYSFDGRTETLEYDFDYVNNEYVFKYVNNISYEPVKLVAEYIDEELYVEFNDEEKHILITGSKSYRVNATWSDYGTEYALTGVLRANDGLTFTGELTEKSSYSNMILDMEFTLKDGVFTAKLNGTDGETKLNMTLEMKKTDTGIICKMVMDFNDPYGETYQAAVQYEFDFANSAITYNASMNSAEMDMEANYKYDFANREYTGEAIITGEGIPNPATLKFTLKNGLFEYVMSDGTQKFGWTFTSEDGLLEGKLFNGELEVRAFIESVIENGVLNVNGGLTSGSAGNIDVIQEAVAFVMSMNLDTLVHDATLTVPVSDLLVESKFDGSVYTFVYDMNGRKVVATAKVVEQENNTFLLIEINAGGMPVVARIGMKMVSENELRFYAEADVNGETAGAAINLNVLESELLQSFAADLELYQAGMTQNLGGISVSLETLTEELEHVEGTPISAEDLVSMIVSLF